MIACQMLPSEGDSSDDKEKPIYPTSSSDDLASKTPSNWWKPLTGLSWQWELDEEQVDISIEADVYDLDLYVAQDIIDELHQLDRKVICYISVGSWEEWRPDGDSFPEELLGKNYRGWPGEKWIDIRRMDLLAPILQARLDLCASKDFDGIEPDNMDIYTNDTGFPLTYEDQLSFAQWLAEAVHERGLGIGMKNAPEQVPDLVGLFDFAITEDCFYEGWCEAMLPFTQNHKPVFAAEYTDSVDSLDAYCGPAKAFGFSLILKKRALDNWREICP